jgi:alpha-1,2-mannosyltransferase
MSGALRRHLASAAIVACGAGGLLGWIGILVARNATELYRQDWIVYYAAGTAAHDGRMALLYDSRRFTGFQYELLAPWFTGPLSLHPFLYPPPYLLFLVPLSRLPFAISFAAFVLASAGAAVLVLAWRGGGKGMNWPRGVMLLCFPATLTTVLTGQNALLSAALMIGGVRLLERQQAAGGAMLGLLAYKPQLFLLVPVALAAARAWRGLAASLLTAALLVVASAALFGPAAWLLWLAQTIRAEDPAYVVWFADTFLRGYSLYVCAALFGLSDAAAMSVQALGAVAAAASVWWAFRHPRAADAQLAILLVATIIATPHLQAYEMVLLAAALILLWGSAEDGIGFGAFAIAAAVWLLPFLRPYIWPSGRVVVPAVLAALLCAAIAQATRQRWHSTPSLAPVPVPSGSRKRR